jgi:hypothetical protein
MLHTKPKDETEPWSATGFLFNTLAHQFSWPCGPRGRRPAARDDLHSQTWTSMQDDGNRVRLVLASEDLVIRHYAKHFGRHFKPSAADGSIT